MSPFCYWCGTCVPDEMPFGPYQVDDKQVHFCDDECKQFYKDFCASFKEEIERDL